VHAPQPSHRRWKGCGTNTASLAYFLLRRWTRVRLSSLRCFFFAIRLRRFLITEPTTTLAHFSSLGAGRLGPHDLRRPSLPAAE
jgi:hypothetical protein